MARTYTDYTFYKNVYRGLLDEAAFGSFLLDASAALEMLTSGRIYRCELTDSDSAQVRLACCALVDTLKINEDGGGIASESNDGVTVNYVAGVSKAKTDDNRIFDAAARYLLDTGLLYRG